VFGRSRLVNWKVVFTKPAQKDARKLAAAGLRAKAEELLATLREDPWRSPPPFEKLLGDLAGAYSRRINIQRRLVYQIIESDRIVKVLRMWTHYE
jgi:toxin YoeB